VSNEDDGTVSVISKESLSVVKTIALPAGSRPHHINDSPDGSFVYVAEFGANRVAAIDTETDTVAVELVTNASVTARTHAVWVSQNNQTLYVTNSGLNEIAAIDIATNTILWSLPVGSNPSEVLVAQNEKKAFVSVRNENKLKVIDLDTRTIVDEINVGPMPDTLRLTPNGRQIIVTLRGMPAQIALVNVFKESSVQPVIISPGSVTGHHWLSQNGRYSFVAVENPGSMAVVDNSTGQVVTTYLYPGANTANRPHGVFYEPTTLTVTVRRPDSSGGGTRLARP
jgi:YVTN family beta-propeller protein